MWAQIIINLSQLKKWGTRQQRHYIVAGDKQSFETGLLGVKFSKRFIWQLESLSDITRLLRISLLFSCPQEKQHHTVSYKVVFQHNFMSSSYKPWTFLSKKNTTEIIVNKVFILKKFTVQSSREIEMNIYNYNCVLRELIEVYTRYLVDKRKEKQSF